MPVIIRSDETTTPRNDGFLVPPWYVEDSVNSLDMNVASLIWGFSIGLAVFCAFKALWQSIRTWHGSHRITLYVILIWGEWLSNVAMSALGWLNLRGVIPSSFWLWLSIVIIWCFQVQLLMQIILNRVSLLILVKENARKLKWIVFLLLLIINISVFLVWIPARLQITEEWIRVNDVWDRMQKGLFLVIDGALNYYFIYLVKARLIADGLDKYNALFRFNLVMMVLSVSLDAILIGLMSLQAKTAYIQFQCLSYLAKLYIEMNMADLIRKIVKEAQNPTDFSGSTCVMTTRPLSDMGNMMSPTCSTRFSQYRRDTLVAGSETCYGDIIAPTHSAAHSAHLAKETPTPPTGMPSSSSEDMEEQMAITRAGSVHFAKVRCDSPPSGADGAGGTASLKGGDHGSRRSSST